MAVKGLPQLSAKLKRLRTATAEPVKVGVGKGAQLIVEEQKRLVPVKTGALRDTIQWTFGDPPAYASVGLRLGGRKENETRATITAGTSAVRYAHLVELGHSGKPGTPYFYPGYRSRRKDAQKIIAAHVRQAVKDAAR
jgi:HK97 gp10 family phage protein